MLASNPVFLAVVKTTRLRFNGLLRQAKIQDDMIYPSKHFFERVVERDMNEVDVLRMLVPVIHEFRGSTYNEKTFLVKWRQFRLAASFQLGIVSEKRRIVLKTVYENDNPNVEYDVTIQI